MALPMVWPGPTAEFNPMLSVIEYHFVGKNDLRMLQAPLLQIELPFPFVAVPCRGILALRFQQAILEYTMAAPASTKRLFPKEWSA